MWCENMPDVAALVRCNPDKDAASGLAIVRETSRTFPFADAAVISDGGGVIAVDTSQPPGMDESSFLASLVTALCRPSLCLAPGALFGAPPMSWVGVGKELIVRCICEIAFGRQPFAGGPPLFLDNFNSVTLKSAAPASALTERPAQVREFAGVRRPQCPRFRGFEGRWPCPRGRPRQTLHLDTA